MVNSKKRIIVSVSNSAVYDNRVLKTCQTLSDFGLEVVILSVNKHKSQKLNHDLFKNHPIKVIFKRNFLYYAEFNIKMFLYLLFKKHDILWANDLDTLLPNYIVSKLKRKPLIFDSHELFAYVAEVKTNSFQQKFWLKLEQNIVPHLKYVITVCQTMQDYYKQYGVKPIVVRNIPKLNANSYPKKQYPLKDTYIIWQGAVNIDRGLEELVLSMKDVPCKLLIFGQGDIYHKLETMIQEQNLQDKVKLMGIQPFSTMMYYTYHATLALSIDKPTNKNYTISLPNKIFEYIHTLTPVLYSPLQEIKPIEEQFHTGIELQSHDPRRISQQINEILSNLELLQRLSDNCLVAQQHFSWQIEEQEIIKLLKTISI